MHFFAYWQRWTCNSLYLDLKINIYDRKGMFNIHCFTLLFEFCGFEALLDSNFMGSSESNKNQCTAFLGFLLPEVLQYSCFLA